MYIDRTINYVEDHDLIAMSKAVLLLDRELQRPEPLVDTLTLGLSFPDVPSFAAGTLLQYARSAGLAGPDRPLDVEQGQYRAVLTVSGLPRDAAVVYTAPERNAFRAYRWHVFLRINALDLLRDTVEGTTPAGGGGRRRRPNALPLSEVHKMVWEDYAQYSLIQIRAVNRALRPMVQVVADLLRRAFRAHAPGNPANPNFNRTLDNVRLRVFRLDLASDWLEDELPASGRAIRAALRSLFPRDSLRAYRDPNWVGLVGDVLKTLGFGLYWKPRTCFLREELRWRPRADLWSLDDDEALAYVERLWKRAKRRGAPFLPRAILNASVAAVDLDDLDLGPLVAQYSPAE